MRRFAVATTLALITASVPLFAVDGQVLINMAAVNAAGGFPYKITQPGSYKLSGNLVVPVGTDGIQINADNVTLDLNGFAISSSNDPSCLTCRQTDGVSSIQYAATIRNGSVTGFYYGILINAGIVEEILAHGNRWGIVLNDTGLARRNYLRQNVVGLYSANGSVLENVAESNAVEGFESFGLFGSNTSYNNGIADTVGGVSQNNNRCNNGAVC